MAADFTDLVAWQEAAKLCGQIVRLAKIMHGPGAAKAADQIVRACDSIAANIAEGYGRGFGADFARFLGIAEGSATEVENHLRIAIIDERLTERQVAPALARCRRVRALIAGLAKYVAARQKPRRAAS